VKSIKLKVPELEQIEINGHVFGIRMTNIEIMNKGRYFADWGAGADLNDVSEMVRMQNEIVGFIDEILGEGAIAKITGGGGISTSTACDWLTVIAEAVGEIETRRMAEFSEKQKEKKTAKADE